MSRLDAEILRVCTAAALLLVFVQANWTAADSPSVKTARLSVLGQIPGLKAAPLAMELDGERIAAAALRLLSQDGEDASVNTKAAHCLLLARAILDASGDGPKFTHMHTARTWWAGRAAVGAFPYISSVMRA